MSARSRCTQLLHCYTQCSCYPRRHHHRRCYRCYPFFHLLALASVIFCRARWETPGGSWGATGRQKPLLYQPLPPPLLQPSPLPPPCALPPFVMSRFSISRHCRRLVRLREPRLHVHLGKPVASSPPHQPSSPPPLPPSLPLSCAPANSPPSSFDSGVTSRLQLLQSLMVSFETLN